MMPLFCWELPSPKMVSIWMPAVMYMRAPASATTASPGSSSTSTNCRSSPSILKSMMSDCRAEAGTGGGAVCGRAGRCPWNFGTSFRGVQPSIPEMKTRVWWSTLPLLMLLTISSSVTGPTCWPPTAMYHWGVEDMLWSPSACRRRPCQAPEPAASTAASSMAPAAADSRRATVDGSIPSRFASPAR
jgi:hypothetical protein